MSLLKGSGVIRRLSEDAPYSRPFDNQSQTYGPFFWVVRDNHISRFGIAPLVYNRTRKRFEKSDAIEGFKGLDEKQKLSEFLQDSLSVSKQYGPVTGLAYGWEHVFGTTSEKFSDVIEFL